METSRRERKPQRVREGESRAPNLIPKIPPEPPTERQSKWRRDCVRYQRTVVMAADRAGLRRVWGVNQAGWYRESD